MADAQDLKSWVRIGRVGSTPTTGTKISVARLRFFLFEEASAISPLGSRKTLVLEGRGTTEQKSEVASETRNKQKASVMTKTHRT